MGHLGHQTNVVKLNLESVFSDVGHYKQYVWDITGTTLWRHKAPLVLILRTRMRKENVSDSIFKIQNISILRAIYFDVFDVGWEGREGAEIRRIQGLGIVYSLLWRNRTAWELVLLYAQIKISFTEHAGRRLGN